MATTSTHEQLGAELGVERPHRPTMTVGEALVGGAIVVFALLAWAALALAHLDSYSLTAVLALAGTAAMIALPVARGAHRAWRWPRLVLDGRELAVLLPLALLAVVLNVPGFPYGLGDKDPGTYVSHGIFIARTGTWQPEDPVLDPARGVGGFQPSSPGARLPGLWYEHRTDGHVTVQFYHLWSAALANAYALGGQTALVNLAPLLGVLSALAVALAVRRAFGRPAGALAGLLLVTSMLQVWQAKYPSAEMLTQLLVTGAMLGVVLTLRTGWRPAAGLAGLLLGLSFLARADGLILVLLAAVVGCALVALGRFDARAGWFAAGLGITLPHGLVQAYGLAGTYTAANQMPGLGLLLGVVTGGFAIALVLRRGAKPLLDAVDGALTRRHTQRLVGGTLTVLAAVAVVVAYFRPQLFGAAYFSYNGQLVRSYDEDTMRRLSWFVTVPGLALMCAGLARVAWARWRAAAWALVLPVLCAFPVYAVAASNSSRLMWWARRFVPVVLPGIAILIAVALAAGLLWRHRGRLPVRATAALAAAALVLVSLSQSVPLRDHREYEGSFAVTRKLAAAAGDRQGVFLFDNTGGESNSAPDFAVPVWLQQGQVSALLRPTPDPKYVMAFVRGFPGQPVFLVVKGDDRPDGYGDLGLSLATRVRTVLPMWDERDDGRPEAAHDVPIDLSVWRVDASLPG